MQVAIQPYRLEHLEKIVALSLRAWEPVFISIKQNFDPELYDYYYPDWRVHQQKEVEKTCKDEEIEVWTAIVDDANGGNGGKSDTVAGFVACKLDAGEKTGEIHMIAVDPQYQRRSELIDFATAKMRKAGMEICMIATGADSGHHPARKSYEKSGFKPWQNVIYFRKL